IDRRSGTATVIRGATTTSHETDQGAVLSFLPGVEPDMRRVDTHASIVFLGKDRVLKVKRAVSLPFLDYSTREKRKQACDEELRVNTLFAPDLYRRVVPIMQGEESLAVDGSGTPGEWAGEMARDDETHVLGRRA